MLFRIQAGLKSGIQLIKLHLHSVLSLFILRVCLGTLRLITTTTNVYIYIYMLSSVEKKTNI